MRPLVPLTTHPAVLLFLPTLVLTVLFAFAQGVRGDTVGYWVGVVSSATVFTVFACAFAAISGAWMASRVRKSRLLYGALTRSPVQVAWVSLWPTLVLASVLQAVGLLIASQHTWGAPGRFPWEVIAAWAAMILLHTVLGYVIGLSLPGVFALPLSLVISYVWLGFTWSVDYIPLRYLAGLALSGCCAVYSSLPAQAPLTVIVFSTGVVVLCVAVIAAWRHRRRAVVFALAAAGMIPVTVVSVGIAQNLGYYPSPPRSEADLVCESRGPTDVCLFPEQLWNAAIEPAPVIADTLDTLRDHGIDVPGRVSGAIAASTEDAVWFVYRSDFSERMIVNSLISSLVPQRQDGEVCPRDDADPERMFLISDVVSYELSSLVRGRADESLNTFTGAEELDAAVASLERLDDDDRAAWINDAIRALRDCDLTYPDVMRATS